MKGARCPLFEWQHLGSTFALRPVLILKVLVGEDLLEPGWPCLPLGRLSVCRPRPARQGASPSPPRGSQTHLERQWGHGPPPSCHLPNYRLLRYLLHPASIPSLLPVCRVEARPAPQRASGWVACRVAVPPRWPHRPIQALGFLTAPTGAPLGLLSAPSPRHLLPCWFLFSALPPTLGPWDPRTLGPWEALTGVHAQSSLVGGGVLEDRGTVRSCLSRSLPPCVTGGVLSLRVTLQQAAVLALERGRMAQPWAQTGPQSSTCPHF